MKCNAVLSVILRFTFALLAFSTLLGLVGSIPSAFAATTDETYRPKYHFSPPSNWLGFPSGLVYLDDVNVPTTGESDPYMEADILAIVEEPSPTDVESEYETEEVSPTGTPTASTEADPLPVQWFVIGSVTVLIALGGGAYFLRRRIQRS